MDWWKEDVTPVLTHWSSVFLAPTHRYIDSYLVSNNILLHDIITQILSQLTSCRMLIQLAWWRHQMKTFSAPLALCVGNPPVTVASPSQRPVARGFDVFFDLRLNKRLSKHSRCQWFETPSRSLWIHCNKGRFPLVEIFDSTRHVDPVTITGPLSGTVTFTRYAVALTTI